MINFSNIDVMTKLKEETPVKNKLNSIEFDSPPIKKSRQQKARRILDDSSDDENVSGVRDKTADQHDGHVSTKENISIQEPPSVLKRSELEHDEEKGKLIEVTSPANERTLVPKRKTGIPVLKFILVELS